METQTTEQLIAAAIERIKAAIKEQTETSPKDGWQRSFEDIVDEGQLDLPEAEDDASATAHLTVWNALNKWWDEHSKSEYDKARAEARKTKLILPGDTIKSAACNGYAIKVYCEDSWGKLFILRNSMGIQGIVQANTWEEAYEVCEDEIFDEAESWDEIVENCGFKPDPHHSGDPGTVHKYLNESGETREHDDVTGSAIFQESYGFRPSGPNSTDTIKHGIYARDLNGDYLDRLTPKLAEELGITVEVENP